LSTQRYEIVLFQQPEAELTLDSLCASTGLHPSFVKQLAEEGLITGVDADPRSQRFHVTTISRLRKIVRLRRVLGINLAGVSVVLDLIDKIEDLQRENRMLRGRT
jgi:MerR family transcriptional regulator/heat shock protein HspR